MRTLVIGDIHGCFDELRDLLDSAALSTDDQIIALGDFMDRGPDSPSVLAFIRDSGNARSLKGNHERKHLLASRGIVKPALSQRLARTQFDDEEYARALEYLESLPFFIELPEAILVHGFWQAGLTLQEQDPLVLQGTMTGQYRLGHHLTGPWFEAYDGPKPLVVGHQDYLQTGDPLIVGDRVFGLDTGCCRGARLTGLLLPEFRIYSVKSRRNYWGELKAGPAVALKQARELPQCLKVRQLLRRSAEDLTWSEARTVLGAPTWLPPLSAKETKDLRQVKDLYDAATAVLPALTDRAAEDCARILREILHASPELALQGRALSLEFAKRAGDSPYGRLLHRVRTRPLKNADIEQVYRFPSATLKAVEDSDAGSG
jgi:serine/threonine protein phosphatase 1